jgi:hypothetical protein
MSETIDAPANEPAATPAPAPVPTGAKRDPDTFSRDYVKDLREELKGWRLTAKDHQTKLEAAEAARAAAEAAMAEKVSAAEAALAEKVSAAEKAANDRILRAELKTAALKAGMVDLDGLKLADLTKVTLDESGEVQGADELMASLKEAKPYLFGQPVQGTSSTAPAPKPGDVKPKTAKEMSAEERARFLREHSAKHR